MLRCCATLDYFDAGPPRRLSLVFSSYDVCNKRLYKSSDESGVSLLLSLKKKVKKISDGVGYLLCGAMEL